MKSADTGKPIDPRWERLQELFSRAVDLPEDERPAFLARETAGDTRLRLELLELLAADSGDGDGNLLTDALGAAIDATGRDRRQALVGRILGNYRLVSVLGHGGTGTVYLAERADRQYSAQVAIKVVDSATLHGDLGLRFRAERQILASLNHPNIARLIDAGETQESQPYLAMEYVHGEPLDRFCDRQQLELHARLRLFLDICNAVQYAHQNLIVHRDLKPANILVTAEGAPKLLDFGIAKLLDTGEAAAKLALTRLNDRLLTPEYASPEQILGRAVTTASDVYALGVVLYELLTGLRPYTVPASASQLELERSICVSDPLRPSAAVRRARENGAAAGQSDISAIALVRGLTADRLERRLLGDLDAIAMRALRKEPDSRYASVEQLAADLRRYLSREPVLARQGNWVYYSQRFIRRHAFGVSAAATFLIFVIAFAIVSSIQMQRIAAERDRAAQESKRAETVSEFMLNVFSNAEPFGEMGAPVTARDLLDRAARTVRNDLSQHPEVRARLLESMGRAYRRRGETEQAISYLKDALHIRRQMPDGGGSAAAAAMAELAITLRQTDDLEGSDRLLKEAMAILHQRHEERSTTYATLLSNRAQVEISSGNMDLAQKYYEQSLALTRELLGPNAKEAADLLSAQSRLYMWGDNLRAAEKAAREAIDIFKLTVPELYPDRVLAQTILGEALYLQDRINEASLLFEKSLEQQRLLFGQNSGQVADILDSLSKIRTAQGLLEDAERFAREAVKVQATAAGEDHVTTGFYRSTLARVLIQRSKHREAELELRASLDIYSKTLPTDHQYVASSEHLLGEVLLATNRMTDAEAVLTAAMNRWKRTNAPAWRSARSASALGEVLYRQGRSIEAERYLVESYRTLVTEQGADRESRAKARERITNFYTDRGQRQKLEELLAISRDTIAPPPAARN
jgi:eukaryotic-like serine/threonine-protein kinase